MAKSDRPVVGVFPPFLNRRASRWGILLLVPLLASCSYTPQQIACMHARDRAQHRGSLLGFALAVLVIVAVVAAYVVRTRTPAPRGWRTPASVLLVLAATGPLGTLFAILGSWWAGRGYHCGDDFNFHAHDLASAIFFDALFLVVPSLFAVTLSLLLLRGAQGLWSSGREGRPA